MLDGNMRGIVYLKHCYDESELINKADITIYKQLLEIDSKLGTTQTEQLFSSFSDVSVGSTPQ